MYTTCPKCKHERQPGVRGNPNVCSACGLIFSKWMKQQFSSTETPKVNDTDNTGPLKPVTTNRLSDNLFFVEDKVNHFIYCGRFIVFIGICVLGWQYIKMDFINNPAEIFNSYLHWINLVSHEVGHFIFLHLGQFMYMLGGTLGQLLIPLFFMLTVLFTNRNNFGASVALWWLGQSFIDCAPYIDDAKSQQLVLLGGLIGPDRASHHDWNVVLVELGKLESHREIATKFDTTGTVLISIALCWGAYILFKQYKNIDLI